MKKKVMATAAALVAIGTASISFASVGIVVGANRIAPDGLPDLGPNEQANIFMCHGQYDVRSLNGMNGPMAEDCAYEKCKAYYGFAPEDGLRNTDPKRKEIAKHCIRDGWAERKGWAVVVLGPKGNNNSIVSKAIGEPNREEAWKYVRSNNFPVSRGTVVYEFYDDNSNGNDSFAVSPKAKYKYFSSPDGENAAGSVEEQAALILIDAEKGNAEAQFKAGDLFRHGIGFNRDITEAIKWYRKAAEQGNQDAQLALNEMHVDGGNPESRLSRKPAEPGESHAE